MPKFLSQICFYFIVVVLLQFLYVSKNHATKFPSGGEGYIVVAGGSYPVDTVNASCNVYDISAGTWSALPNLPSGRYGGGVVAHQGNVYYVSGRCKCKSDYTKEVLALKTNLNAWIDGPPLITFAGEGVNAFSLNGSLYALGGKQTHVERFDCISGSYVWEQVASTLETHYYSGAAELNGYIYVCGTTYRNPSTFCERYDPAANQWSTITPMNVARDAFSMVALNGYLYVIGGADANNERYGPASGQWTYFNNNPNQRKFTAATTDGKAIYVVGGFDPGNVIVPDMSVYLPEFDIWQQKNPYPMSTYTTGAVFVKTLP